MRHKMNTREPLFRLSDVQAGFEMLRQQQDRSHLKLEIILCSDNLRTSLIIFDLNALEICTSVCKTRRKGEGSCSKRSMNAGSTCVRSRSVFHNMVTFALRESLMVHSNSPSFAVCTQSVRETITFKLPSVLVGLLLKLFLCVTSTMCTCEIAGKTMKNS